MAEEDTFGSGNFGRSGLFSPAYFRQLFAGMFGVVAADIAIGQDNVGDFTALFGPFSGCASYAKFDVIGVGEDEHGAFGDVLSHGG